MRDSQYHGCTVACKENNVYNIYLKNKTAAMPLSGSSGEFSAGSEPVRPENPDPEDPGGAGGAHDPLRDDAVMKRIRRGYHHMQRIVCPGTD